MEEKNKTYWFAFIGNSIVLEHDDKGYHVPCSAEPPLPLKAWTPRQELPPMNGMPCIAYSIDTPPEGGLGALETIGLRQSGLCCLKTFTEKLARQPNCYTGTATHATAECAAHPCHVTLQSANDALIAERRFGRRSVLPSSSAYAKTTTSFWCMPSISNEARCMDL